jgi:hypothetical protein
MGRNTCEPGSHDGPESVHSCLKWVYTSPSDTWDPLRAGDINIHNVDRHGNPLSVLTHNPDMSQVHLNNPYM